MILKYVVVLVTTKVDVFLFVTPPIITAESFRIKFHVLLLGLQYTVNTAV